MEASTGIREGRYREQNAAFHGVRHSLWTSGKRGSGGGGEYEHVELDEVGLINRPANVVSVESSQPGHQTPGSSHGDVEVTRGVRVDSASIVGGIAISLKRSDTPPFPNGPVRRSSVAKVIEE
ncbi:hypothetical protein INS49_008452 [Diaporthe citri]|uniref:uncharacterized protein n=1 Tax=Diaporthe citri TaxID=83186 RepID=UPI001C7E3950|nr:uncharacterized protein INS49_008452 [Diaporthe citri]KAG6363355.1 hypothetical protein INS49_008452 [Diaporthe citri]